MQATEYKSMDMEPALYMFYLNTCQRKKIYYSLQDAAYYASHLRENHQNAEHIAPYQCSFNTVHWHVGNSLPEMKWWHEMMHTQAQEWVAVHGPVQRGNKGAA